MRLWVFDVDTFVTLFSLIYCCISSFVTVEDCIFSGVTFVALLFVFD